jgi:acyl carrier protein
MSATYDKVFTVLTEQLGVDSTLISPEATLDDLELDSLSLVELAVILLDDVGVEVDDLDRSATLAEVAARIDRQMASEGR